MNSPEDQKQQVKTDDENRPVASSGNNEEKRNDEEEDGEFYDAPEEAVPAVDKLNLDDDEETPDSKVNLKIF